MVSKKSLVFGYGMGFLLGVLLVLSIAALGAFIVINCLNYLFPVLQIPVDFWGICSMMFLLIVFHQRNIMFYGKKQNV